MRWYLNKPVYRIIVDPENEFEIRGLDLVKRGEISHAQRIPYDGNLAVNCSGQLHVEKLDRCS